MKVVLLQDIKSLGKKDAVVNVSDGYARNYLFPQKKAVEATKANLNVLKQQQAATKAEPIMTLMVQEVINRLDEV